MEEEHEDVKKMTEFINKQKSSCQSNFQIEFEDFVSYKHDDNSDQEFDDGLFDEEEEGTINNLYKDKESGPSLAFTEEEQNIIDLCTDLELKKLLILNRSKNMQLIKLHKRIHEYLIECEEEVEEKRHALKTFETKQLNHQTFVWKLAAPYFKDKRFFPCPLNHDAVQKRAGNELSVYDIVPSPKWTIIEFDRLTNAVKCNYNINRQNNIVSKISTLKIKIQNEQSENGSLMEEIVNLKEHLEKVKLDNKVPPLNSNEFIDWYKVSETFLKDKHTALECQSVWHMLVHPQIKKSEWSEEENNKLESIAKAHSHQNWDAIAAELNTNRTGFTTCLHYFSKLCDKFKKSKFSSEEDSFLLDVVAMYKVGNFIPWNKVVCHFNNRSRHQLYHRYTYFLSQKHVKRGKFAEAEDILLLILVNKFGRNFKKCSEYMPHRSQIQLKSRYNSNLQRQIRKGTFTTEDDQIIYNYAKEHGEKSWSGLTVKLTRCNAQIRQRYRLIKAFLQENPNSTVADIPKRRHRYDEVNEGQYNFLNYVAEQYKDVDGVPTLSMIEESLQVTLGTSTRIQNEITESNSSAIKLKNIDAMLTDIFSSSMKIRHSNTITESNLNEATESAEEILTILGVKLDIPENLKCNIYLDNMDLEILERISKKVSSTSHLEPQRLVPPNISTLVGLRSLIIKHKEYKSKQKHEAKPSVSACDYFGNLNESRRKEILFHREQFSERFNTLFHWSAILSLEKPNQGDTPEQSNIVGNQVLPSLERTYGKRQNPPDHTIVKRRKIDVSALANLSKHPQLRLVDKNVVENLIKMNNINVIRLETVPGFMPQVNNYSSQSRTELVTSCNDTSHIIDLSHDIVEDVSDSDMHDVEKLNAILKKMKSEGNISSTCGSKEYQSVKNDVQLLKEVLNFEKVKVKSDPDGF